MSTKYDDLAARAERGEFTMKPGTVGRGAEAVAEAQRLLMEATGTTTTGDAARVALGRPSLGATGGASPVVRARVPQALKDQVIELAKRNHVKESDVVREALAAWVERAAS